MAADGQGNSRSWEISPEAGGAYEGEEEGAVDGHPPGPWLGQEVLKSWPIKQHVAAQQRYHIVNDD